jgi:hypothetical protein
VLLTAFRDSEILGTSKVASHAHRKRNHLLDTTTAVSVPAAQKAAPVKLNAKNMERLKSYTGIFDANLTLVVNRAVEEWLDAVGDVRIEAVSRTSDAN